MSQPDIKIVWRIPKKDWYSKGKKAAEIFMDQLEGASWVAVMIGANCTWIGWGRKYINIGIERKYLYPRFDRRSK